MVFRYKGLEVLGLGGLEGLKSLGGLRGLDRLKFKLQSRYQVQDIIKKFYTSIESNASKFLIPLTRLRFEFEFALNLQTPVDLFLSLFLQVIIRF